MNALLLIAGQRFFMRHPWQLLLAVAGISLGVAVFVGVQLANDSARRAFTLSADVVLGRTTHRLVPLRGGLDDSVYRQLVIDASIARAAPVVEGRIELAELGRTATLLGIDPLQDGAFRSFGYGSNPGENTAINRLIVEPNAVLLPATLAGALDAGAGDPIELRVDGRTRTGRVLGVMETAPEGVDPPIVTDVSTAQELLARVSRLSRIDLILDAEQAARLRAALPANAYLVPATSQDRTFAQLTGAFHLNLTALSLLAFMVGVFLIYATMSFAVVQRRRTIGVLKALGAGRRTIVSGILLEAAVIGVAATVVGLLIGQLLANGLVGLVLTTIDDLYFSANVTAARPSPLIYAQGLGLGLAATLCAALAPALDAARTLPGAAISRASLERSAHRQSGRAAMLSLPAALLGIALLGFGPNDVYTAFAALFCVLLAGALVAPAATIWQMRLFEPFARRGFGVPGTLAVRGVSASLSRTGVAAAALTVAVSAVIGIGVMIASFRSSLVDWLDTTLVADLYVTDVAANSADATLPASTIAALGELEDVEGLSLTRALRLPSEYGELGVRAVRPGPEGWGVALLEAAGDAPLEDLAAGRGVLVSEVLAARLAIGPMDTLTLPAVESEREFTVLGVFRDYNTDGGAVLMSLELYRRHWADARVSGIGLYLADRERAGSVRTQIDELLAGRDVRIRTNEAIRLQSLAVFDRTFTITEVLRLLAGLVAFFGVCSALLAIQLERGREIAVLRAIGFTPRDSRRLHLVQSSLLGLASGVLAIPLGTVLAALLVFVINRRSFGWTMDFVVPLPTILLGVGLAVVASLLAGVYPALRSGRGTLADQLRDE